MNTNICDGWEVWCVMRNGIVRAGERGDNGRVMSDQKTGSDTCSQTRLARAMSKRRNSNRKGMSAGRYIISLCLLWVATDWFSTALSYSSKCGDLRQWWWLCYPLLTNDADTKYTQVFTQVHSPCILREGNKSHANILPLWLLVIHITMIILLFPIQEKNSGTPIGNI